VGELINVMQRGSASLNRVLDTLSHEEDVKEHHAPKHHESPGTISFEHVQFTYPTSSVTNLHDVSFTLEKGQTLGIVGRTGSGKPTLLKQLL
ncbi:ATP-binding cassette domain-containing protein, partial [Micrococcus sp. SIMBA_131]